MAIFIFDDPINLALSSIPGAYNNEVDAGHFEQKLANRKITIKIDAMPRVILFLLVFAVLDCNPNHTQTMPAYSKEGPIRLNPENPHYFLYKGKTKALITSGEHYGSVLNLDFDYKKYLKTLFDDGMNYTRIFSGSYFEIYGQSFGIQHNTLAPKQDRIITPWMVDDDHNGKPKYDLTKWNAQYFDRLKDFIGTASKYDIIVEVTLFSSIYNDDHWNINPQNPSNNVNIDQSLDRRDAQTLSNGKLLEFQEFFVRKMVDELNKFDNFFFEIQNEPWADRPVAAYNIVNKEELDPKDWTYKADFADEASMAWQKRMATIIVDEAGKLDKKHLIAQNYTNFKAPIPQVDSLISIINFHYAWPEAVTWNFQFNKVIGFDESGFAGPDDQVYRRQAWQFMLSGGGLFNNLDYSFFVGQEDGLGENRAPGGGSLHLRKQLKILADFLSGFQLEKLHPDCTCITSSPGLIPFVLSDKDKTYAIFLRSVGTKKSTLKIKLLKGYYKVQYLNTISGVYSGPQTLATNEDTLSMSFEIPDQELAIKIVRE